MPKNFHIAPFLTFLVKKKENFQLNPVRRFKFPQTPFESYLGLMAKMRVQSLVSHNLGWSSKLIH